MKFSEGLNKIFTPLSIGKWMDIEVFIHWSWWMMLIFLLAVSPMSAAVFVGLFSIMFLHELGHCWAAKRCNLEVDSVMLYIIGGVARIRGDGLLKNEAFVTACGPLVNVLLIPVLFVLTELSTNVPMLFFFLQKLAFANLAILIFNLIPAFPLDGGRLLRAFLGSKVGYLRGTEWSVMISSLISVGFGVYGLMIGHYSLIVIALFLYYAAQQEMQNLQSLYRVYTQDALKSSQRTIAELHNRLEEIRDQNR